MAKSNKQQLDELLGILEEVRGGTADPAPQQTVIPDDLPESGTTVVNNAPPPNMPPKKRDDLSINEKDDRELAETQRNLAQIDELIAVSKNVMQHVYGVVTSTDILDAATITAAAKLISETRALIAEHLTIQKDERDFLNKVQMESIKHRHQMELMEKKYELEQKRLQQKNPPLDAPMANVPTTQGATGGLKAYSSADMMRMLNEEDDQ